MKVIMPIDCDKKNICVSFGRAPYFLVYDDEKDTYEELTNPAADAQGGAGLKAAQFAADTGAKVLITVRCGENAAEVLKACNIKILKSSSMDARENISLYKQNKLEPLTAFHAGYHGLR